MIEPQRQIDLSTDQVNRENHTHEFLLAGCIIDDESIGFENCPEEKIEMKHEDPLKKVNLGSEQK